MRILHAVHNFPPEFVGGTEAYLAALCQAQRRTGHDVRVVTGSGVAGPRVRDEDHAGTPVWRLHHDPAEERYSVDLRIPRLTGVFRELLARWRPDLVHVHHYLNLGVAMVAEARASGVPAFVSLHDFTAACPRFFLIRPDGYFCGEHTPVPLQRCIDCCAAEFAGPRPALAAEFAQRRAFFAAELSGAAAVLVPSERAAGYLAATGILPDVPLVALPLGLLHALQPVPVPPRRQDRLRLVFFGNLAPVKGVDWLLQAIDSLDPARRARVALLLLGRATDAALAARIDEFAQRLDVVREAGFDARRLERLPAEVDLAVFPGAAAETYSLVVDEALALGLPLILSDRGAGPERAGAAAIVVKTGDVGALAAAIAELLDAPERLARLREAACLRRFTIDDHAARLDEIYRGVV